MDSSSEIRKFTGSLDSFSLTQLIVLGGGGNTANRNSTILLQRSRSYEIWRARVFIRGKYIVGIWANNQETDPVSVLLRRNRLSKPEATLILKKTAGLSQLEVIEFIYFIGIANELDIIKAYTDDVTDMYNKLMTWITAKYMILTNYLPPSLPPIEVAVRQIEGIMDGDRKKYKPANIVEEDDLIE